MERLVIAVTILVLFVSRGGSCRRGPCCAAATPRGPIIPKVEPLKPQPFTIEDRYLDAARRGDLAMLKMCLDKGADAQAKDALGRSAFLLAVRDARNLEMAKFLEGRGLPIDDPDVSGRTPLSYAAGNGDSAIVSYLLDQGAKPDRRDTQGQSPLFNAVLGGSKDAVARLLAAKVDVNVRDRFGDTPLMGACNKGFDDIARMLVEKGADPTLKDQEGRTAPERADASATLLS